MPTSHAAPSSSSPAASAPPIIEAAGLALAFRSLDLSPFASGPRKQVVEAVRDLSFALAPGECLGLLGHNGSGKSTTIKMVLGLLAPGAGRLQVFGQPAGHRSARGRTGYVPEEARQLGRLTGREAVDLFARLQGVGPRGVRRQKTAASLAAVGLPEESWRRSIGTYSRGMTRRLALATAWVHEPDLLVLDEPTSGLDPAGVSEILALLRGHLARGGAILISTHDRVTTEGLCDRVLVLAKGRAVGEGRPEQLLAGDSSPSLESLLRRAEQGELA